MVHLWEITGGSQNHLAEKVLCLLRRMQLFNPDFIVLLHTGHGRLEESLSPDAFPCTPHLSLG